MKDDQRNTDIGKIIRASMELTDEPSVELNNKIKAALYQQEAVMRKTACYKSCIALVSADDF